MSNAARIINHPNVTQAKERKSSPRMRVQKPRSRAVKGSTIVFQVRQAFLPQNRLAASLGALLGGLVPLASYTIAHNEYDATKPWYQIASWIVAACLLYSSTSVYQWGKLAFKSGVKSLGFVVLMEGILIASRTEWLAIACLVYLVAINAVATGCNLVVKESDA
jgi:hypothetical protein